MKNIEGKRDMEELQMPKVRFELPTIEEETNTIFNFCYRKSSGGWDWSHYVYGQHPKLKEMVKGIEDKKEFYAKCREYIEEYLCENKKTIEEARERFQESWDQIEEKFYNDLSSDFETGFPKEIKEIRAKVSINPICPRYLDSWSFNVFYKQTETIMKKTTIHETIHFLYFKKWLEVFPDYDKKTFNGPHSEWKLSEILVNPIMNNNKNIQDVIDNKISDGYKEFQHIKIDGKSLNDYFGDIYKEHLEGKISFGDFLKISWDKYRENKDIIENDAKK